MITTPLIFLKPNCRGEVVRYLLIRSKIDCYKILDILCVHHWIWSARILERAVPCSLKK